MTMQNLKPLQWFASTPSVSMRAPENKKDKKIIKTLTNIENAGEGGFYSALRERVAGLALCPTCINEEGKQRLSIIATSYFNGAVYSAIITSSNLHPSPFEDCIHSFFLWGACKSKMNPS